MEVIYLLSKALQTGPVNQALNILIGLNKVEGVHAILVTLEPEVEGHSWLERFKNNGIEIVQLNGSAIGTSRCVRKLKSIIKERSIDVVHSSGFHVDFVNMQLRHVVKTVSTQRCNPDEIVEMFPKWIRPPFEKLHLSIIKRIDRVVACSKSVQRVFTEDYNLPVDAVQNGVNTDFFKPSTNEEKLALRKKLNLTTDKTIYLVLGGLIPRKNVGLIINAFKSVDNPNIQLVIVGAGASGNELKSLAEKDERIIFTGSTSTPIKYLQASDILISSALAEGLPNTVLEALACGLPCILSDIDPHKEIFETKVVGSMFDRYSETELAARIIDSQEWDVLEMSKEARQLAESQFGLSILAKKYVDCYRSILK